jgi:hypothetical protein
MSLVEVDYNDIVEKNEAGDDKALASFNPVDASVYVNRVCAENSKHPHIDVIENA